MSTEFQTRDQKLQFALQLREQEVEDYQINIANYMLAIAEIDAMSQEQRTEQADFRSQLETLLASERREQSKAQIMLNVLRKQVEGSSGQPASSPAV